MNMGKIVHFFKKIKNSIKIKFKMKSTIKTKLMATFLIMATLPIIIVGSFSYIIAENTVEKSVYFFTTITQSD
jgi:undecaprenyl pyrophosphate phosphatase UppP